MPADTRTRFQSWSLWGGVGAAALVFALVKAPEGRPLVPHMAAFATLVAVWWVTEAIPLAATSLLPLVVLPLTGILGSAATVGAYFSPTTALLLGGFLIALAIEHWNVHRRLALTVIARCGVRPDSMVLGFLISTAAVSMWISNTAAAMMMMPIGMAIITQVETAFGRERTRSLAIGVMLAIAYGASVGGCATLIGTPPNLVFKSIHEATFPSAPPITFGQWMAVGLPVSAALLLAVWFVITRWFWRIDCSIQLDRDLIRSELAALGPLRREERIILAVFGGAALLWTFRQDIPLGGWTIYGWSRLAPWLAHADDGTVAIALALTLFIVTGVKDGRRRPLLEGKVFQEVPWGIIVLFGGGLSLAAGFNSSGLSQWCADWCGGIGPLPPWALLTLVCLFINFFTELTSNTAIAQIFLPVLAATAVGRGLPPIYLMLPATLSATMGFMLPIGTPPNAIVFGSGRLTIRDMAGTGFVLNLFAIIIVAAAGHWLVPVVFGFPRP